MKLKVFLNLNHKLLGREYQYKLDTYFKKSIYREMYPQKICKSSLSAFDEKRFSLKEVESLP